MEEISLRELIEILIKRKTVIISFALVFIIASFIYSFFILNPIFETRMVLMASNFADRLQSPQATGQGVEGILNSMSNFPNMTLETYRQQIKAPRIMRETIRELGLEDQFDVESLARKINLETVRDTNLITIRMQSEDPELSAKIVNKVGEMFVAFVSYKAREHTALISQYVESQVEVEKEKLENALLELKNFLSQSRGVEELTRELDAKLELLTNFKTQVIDERLRVETYKSGIDAVQQQIGNTNKVLVTSRSILEDPQMMSVHNSASGGENLMGILGLRVESEEINPVYIELQSRLNELQFERIKLDTNIRVTEQQIKELQEVIDVLQADLADATHQEQLIKQRVSIAQNNYDAFLKKHEELRLAESSLIGEASLVVVSRAFPTQIPIGPNKKLNIAIAAVLGLMIGVFIAFFIEYWKATENIENHNQAN